MNILVIYVYTCFDFSIKIHNLSLLGDLFPGVEPNEEPNFIISEKEQFKTYRDKDGDGYLDIGEVS